MKHRSAIPEYDVWVQMRRRCRSPKSQRYKYYGARGIKVCVRWESFENFIADMGSRPSPKHSIHRVDNDGNYTPDNCRWVTQLEQNGGRSGYKAWGKIQAFGKNLSVRQWAAELGVVSADAIWLRLRRGWDAEKAISTPPQVKRKRSLIAQGAFRLNTHEHLKSLIS